MVSPSNLLTIGGSKHDMIGTSNETKYKNIIKKKCNPYKNFNDLLSSTFKCDAYWRYQTVPPTTPAGYVAIFIGITAERVASRQITPEGEQKTQINNNNTIIQTTIIYALTKRGERVCDIEICGSDIKCWQLI